MTARATISSLGAGWFLGLRFLVVLVIAIIIKILLNLVHIRFNLCLFWKRVNN